MNSRKRIVFKGVFNYVRNGIANVVTQEGIAEMSITDTSVVAQEDVAKCQLRTP